MSPGAPSIDAWHVREFEVWTDRINHDSWEVDADTGDLWIVEEGQPWSFPNDDADYFFDKLYKVPDFFPKDDTYYDQVREELKAGADTFSKAFLLAHLPRILALRYMRSPGSEQVNFKNMCLMIYWCKLAGIWLPGLEALQKVYVGVNSRRIGDTTIDGMILRPDPPSRELEEFCALLCLPNLSEVYFAHLDGNSDISSEITDLFPDGLQPLLDKASPVQTIINKLEASLSAQLMEFITKSPSSLKNLAIRFHPFNEYGNCRRDDTSDGKRRSQELTQKLAQHQHSSLQLCFYTEAVRDGLSDWNWVAPSQRVMFDIRVAYFYWTMVEEEMASPAAAVRSRSELLDQLVQAFRSQFPATIEMIYFNGFSRSHSIFQSAESDDPPLDYVDDVVEAMITSERYKNLKAVHLRDIQAEATPDETPDYFPSPKTVRAAEERGVYVHVKGSKPPSWFSFKGEFIPIPTRDCMVTGRFLPEEEDPYLAHCAWEDQGMPVTSESP